MSIPAARIVRRIARSFAGRSVVKYASSLTGRRDLGPARPPRSTAHPSAPLATRIPAASSASPAGVSKVALM